jgi:drug/metabolite transporter (DMT)-like permease
VSAKPTNAALTTGLLAAILLWGGNNVGMKWLVNRWPPITTGATRFALAGFILWALLRWTRWLGRGATVSAADSRALWRRGGLSLAIYICGCNWSLMFIPASHFALHMAASPVWALLWEARVERRRPALRDALASLLAFAGVLVLFWPALRAAHGAQGLGEGLALASSLLWVNYSRDCRAHTRTLPGVVVTAATMWRAGIWLLGPALVELAVRRAGTVDARSLGVYVFCVTLGGAAPFALWNQALAHWPPSRVFLFSNLIPLSSALWARAALGEALTATFGFAMLLIVSGVLLGQVNWARRLRWWVPEE